MTYKKHIWEKGEKITSELLNNMETEIEATSKDIEKIYLKFENIDTLVGLEGEALEIKPLKKDAQLPDLITKINELISVLQVRGISK